MICGSATTLIRTGARRRIKKFSLARLDEFTRQCPDALFRAGVPEAKSVAVLPGLLLWQEPGKSEPVAQGALALVGAGPQASTEAFLPLAGPLILKPAPGVRAGAVPGGYGKKHTAFSKLGAAKARVQRPEGLPHV